MTAGILVCCMPTTAAVIRRWKSPVSSFLTSFRRRIPPNSSSSLESHAKVNCLPDLRPSHRHQRHDTESREAISLVEKGSSDSGPSTLIWSQHEAISSLDTSIRDTSIRKTTHLDVWSTSHLETQRSSATELEH